MKTEAIMDKKGHIFDWYSRCYGGFGGVGFLYARESRTVNVFAKEAVKKVLNPK